MAFVVLVGIAGGVGYHWSDLLDANGEPDVLLTGIWFWLALLVCWGVRARHDLLLVLTGLGGGAVIETWGTQTGLWHYFTEERPPLWILPAWPVAALAIDRQARWLDDLMAGVGAKASARHSLWVYWLLCGGFCLWMGWFMRPVWNHSATVAVLLIMVVVVASVRDARADVTLFLAGSLLGVFLEYWGTSRGCWTYYSGEVPPPVAIPAHGFAALAFSRVHRLLLRKFRPLAAVRYES